MKTFSSNWIAKLNAQHSGGVFVKAAILVVDGSTTKYYADAHDNITFDGQTYTPLSMAWEGEGQNAAMELPSVRVTVPNADGAVGAFLETKDLLGNDVTLQILHLDLLGVATDVEKVKLQIMMIESTWEIATFTLGLNLALDQQLPKHVITRAEFPGVPDQYRRASIL